MNVARPTTLLTEPLTDTLPLSEALSALDHVIAHHGPHGLMVKPREKSAADALAAALRYLCAQARNGRSGGAEGMVIALHAAWPELPAVRRLCVDENPDALLDCIVSLAIAEFYAAPYGSGSAVELRDGSPAPLAIPQPSLNSR